MLDIIYKRITCDKCNNKFTAKLDTSYTCTKCNNIIHTNIPEEKEPDYNLFYYCAYKNNLIQKEKGRYCQFNGQIIR